MTTTRDDLQRMADAAADLMEEAIARILSETGYPAAPVLIGAHAQLVVAMTAALGGPMAARCCERAAARVRDLPSAAAVSLALSPTAGKRDGRGSFPKPTAAGRSGPDV